MKIKTTYIFEVVCWIATLSFCVFWIYKYNLNEDLCSIEFKSFYEEKNDAFPILSLCLLNPFSNSKFRTHDFEIDQKTYLKFIHGEEFNSSWLDIDYQTIIKNISDFVEQDSIGFRNGSRLYFHPDYNGTSNYQPHADYQTNLGMVYSLPVIVGWGFFNCYGLSIPHDKNIDFFTFRVKSNIFPSGFRPEKYSLMTLLHYPNQMMYSSKTMNYAWPQDRQKQESYIMRFKVSKVEVLRRRYKERHPCIENWEEYDSLIVRNHINRIGCIPVYLNSSAEGNSVPLCSTREDMKNAKFELQSDGYGISPPCTSMEEISYEYTESSFNLSETSFAREGVFWIRMVFSNRHFKDIVQTKAINEHALVGNIGGYLGLFMGYSILQLPIVFHILLNKLEHLYYRLKSMVHPEFHLSFQDEVKEVSTSKDDQTIAITQTENFEANVKSSLSKLDGKIEFIQERLLKLETTIKELLISKYSK